MRKIFDGEYKKLNDDVSFQILRTNPRLTTNTKLMYDGEKIYMESYNANDLLSTNKYKHKRIYKSGLYNNDIKNFLIGTGSSAYSIGKKLENTVVGTDYSYQYENMYWSGCEEVSSNLYSEEFGIVSPIYLRKKIPNYFVIFKVDGPSNKSYINGESFDFKNNILNKCRMVKSFDLREGTPIGDYLRRYVSQTTFEYDKSIYVNYSTNEIYYYGIDINSGLMTRKVENFENELMLNDNTIIHSDDWITNGFYRNGLIFPYILNIEFLFDDNETKDFEFCRYFGLYCDDIDLYELEDINKEIIPVGRDNVYYVKDKYNNLYSLDKYILFDGSNDNVYFSSIDKRENIKEKTSNGITNLFETDKTYDFKCKKSDISLSCESISALDTIGFNDYNINDGQYIYDACVVMVKKPFGDNGLCTSSKLVNDEYLTGYCPKSISLYCDYVDGNGYASYMFSIEKKLTHGETLTLLYDNGNNFVITAEEYIQDNGHEELNPIGSFSDNRFSCNGTINEVASCICECINSNSSIPFVAKNVNNIIVIQYTLSGSIYNQMCEIKFSNSILYNKKIKKYSLYDNKFSGGTDSDFCRFKVNIDDIIQLIGEENNERYIKTPGDCENAKIISYSYTIDEFGDIDYNNYIISTDENGNNVRISDIKQIEIVDKFHSKIGMLSFYPIKDFDFDTIYSQYCDNSAFNIEVEDSIEGLNLSNLSDYEKKSYKKLYTDILSIDRIYRNDGTKMMSEYDYYNENLLSSLCTVSKTAPYISKWGYVDGLDSCENPYRLNCSKIFGVNNFSANPFLINASIYDYTHEMPYYICDDFPTTNTNDVDYSKIKNIVNQYQYIYYSHSFDNNGKPLKMTNYTDCVDYWKKMLSRTDKNMFEFLFEYRNNSGKTQKRNDKKYSTFKYGSSNKNPETLFRGVKFETITKMKNKSDEFKNIYSNKFNDYKFSFLYIPVSETDTLYFNNKIYFVKNDTFKYIVGFIVFNMLNTDIFNKFHLYSGCLGLIKSSNIDDKISGLDISKINYYYDGNETTKIKYNNLLYNDIGFDDNKVDENGNVRIIYYDNNSKLQKSILVNLNVAKGKLSKNIVCHLNMNFESAFSYASNDNIIYLDELNIKSSIIRCIMKNLSTKFGECSIDKLEITTSDYKNNNSPRTYVIFDKDDITIENYTKIKIKNDLKGNIIIKDYDDEEIVVKFDIVLNLFNVKNVSDNSDVKNSIYSNIYDMYNDVSIYNIKENINNGYNIEYDSNDYEIRIIEPVSINTYDIFENNIVSTEVYNNKIIENVGISVKNNTDDVGIKILNRYSGYYHPIFKDIIFYNDFEITDSISNKKILYKYTNTSFDVNYSDNQGSFGIINNMFYHKINEDKIILKSVSPYYPLIGEYALDYKDYNIFSSNWDSGYYIKHIDTDKSEELDYIASIENGLYMFGSKYMNLPETVNIDSLIGAEKWNEDYLRLQIDCESEVMYNEIDNSKVEFCLFLNNRIVRYFCELDEIKNEFSKWISEDKSYGLKNTLEDDIEEYVIRNVLKLYDISEIKMFVKKVKRGINDEQIENDYGLYFNDENNHWGEDELKKDGFEEVKSFTINDIGFNKFDKKITYTFSTGIQEYFAFSFVIKKI